MYVYKMTAELHGQEGNWLFSIYNPANCMNNNLELKETVVQPTEEILLK